MIMIALKKKKGGEEGGGEYRFAYRSLEPDVAGELGVLDRVGLALDGIPLAGFTKRYVSTIVFFLTQKHAEEKKRGGVRLGCSHVQVEDVVPEDLQGPLVVINLHGQPRVAALVVRIHVPLHAEEDNSMLAL